MKILITGGAGFIGSHLTRRLLQEGHSIISIDNFSTGQKRNIQDFVKNPRFQFTKHDIVKPIHFSGNLDQIYNLACPASPQHYQKDPVHTLLTNTVGVHNLLTLAHKKHARFFQASTSEVYGDPQQHPQKETYWGHVNPNGPRSCYDEGKRVAESLVFAFAQTKKLEIRIARIFNTYGPSMALDDGRVVSNLIVQSLTGASMTLSGKGQQTRSFCYVDDLVEGILKLMNHKNFQGPVNLGNPKEYTVKQLAEKIQKLTQTDAKMIYIPLPQDDPARRKPDIHLAQKMLKWQPHVTLQTGLQKTIAYFRDRLS